jgi:Bardet-Biedl syndrome 7 protein
MQLVDAIQELSMQDNNYQDWLSPEYQEILKDQETIRNQFKNRERSMEYLAGIITDLYVDWNRIQGTDMKHKLPQLHNLIVNPAGNSDFSQIIKFFNLK